MRFVSRVVGRGRVCPQQGLTTTAIRKEGAQEQKHKKETRTAAFVEGTAGRPINPRIFVVTTGRIAALQIGYVRTHILALARVLAEYLSTCGWGEKNRRLQICCWCRVSRHAKKREERKKRNKQ